MPDQVIKGDLCENNFFMVRRMIILRRGLDPSSQLLRSILGLKLIQLEAEFNPGDDPDDEDPEPMPVEDLKQLKFYHEKESRGR